MIAGLAQTPTTADMDEMIEAYRSSDKKEDNSNQLGEFNPIKILAKQSISIPLRRM